MSPLTDIYGNPLLTWQNLMLLVIYWFLIYYALKFRITMVFLGRPKRRRTRRVTRD